MDRRFFGIVFVRPHAERAAGNKDHLGSRRLSLIGSTRKIPKLHSFRGVEVSHCLLIP